MLEFLYRVISKLWSSKGTDDAPQLLEDDWIILLSDYELDFERFAEKSQTQVVDELDVLRKRNSQQQRNLIIERLKCTLSDADLEDVKMVALSSDLRGKIYKDVFLKLADEWFQGIHKIYGNVSELEGNWLPTSYQKNIIGQMIDMADRTSPEKLTVSGMVQTIKNVHLCLYQELASFNVRSDVSQTQELLHLIMKMVVPIVQLWCQTVKISRLGIANQGQLPEKWAKEEEEHKHYIKNLKDSGKVDHRYADGPIDLVIQKVAPDDFKERRAMLEKKLQRKYNRSKPEEVDYSVEKFQKTQKQLAARLTFKCKSQ